MNVIDCIILAGIGILTVFAVLFALSILIRLISFTVHLQTPWKRHAKVSLSGHGSIPLLSVSNISRGLCKQYQVDDRTSLMEIKVISFKGSFISSATIAITIAAVRSST